MGPTRWQCPYDTEVWGLNNGYKEVVQLGKRLDKVFIAHRQVYTKEGNLLFDWKELSQFDVVSLHRIKGLKAKQFPLKRISRKFRTSYFSDSICYMLAYALDMCTDRNLKVKNRRKIRLYGVDMHEDGEYIQEKGGIEWWLGVARGLGIDYEISLGSNLMRTVTGRPYGFKVKHQAGRKGNLMGEITIVTDDIEKVTEETLEKLLGG